MSNTEQWRKLWKTICLNIATKSCWSTNNKNRTFFPSVVLAGNQLIDCQHIRVFTGHSCWHYIHSSNVCIETGDSILEGGIWMENIGAMHTVLITRSNFLQWLSVGKYWNCKKQRRSASCWMDEQWSSRDDREERRMKGEYEHQSY